MPKDPNNKYWRFPDHNTWIRARINSNSKGQIIQVVKDVLSKCGMLERFRNGLFGHYLDLPQPVVVHGILIYNLFKKEIILPKVREDEMWFGLGHKKVCFGKEQFCVCSGLKMGPIPEGFMKMKPDVEGYWYTKYFKHRPTPEVLESFFSQGTEAEGEDLLKMAYILMVCQFFGKDDHRSAVPGWLIALANNEQAFTNFSWGTYIFSMTLFWFHCSIEKRLNRLRGGNKKMAKGMGKRKPGEEDEEEIEEEEEDNEEEYDEEEHSEAEGKKVKSKGKQKADVVPKEKKKTFTYNLHGFALALKVWAFETIPRLTNLVGTRIGSGFPRIKNWDFNKKSVKIENKFTSGGCISLVNWEVEPKEMETDYYKSLDPDNVCEKLLHKGNVVVVEDVIDDEEDVGSDKERDEILEDPANINDGDAAFSNHQRTASVMRSSNSISEPPAKKQLFPFTREHQTPKTSVPSNIAELYSVVDVLIKESEERMTEFCRTEFRSIREEMTALQKVGDTPVVVTAEQHIHPSSNIGSGEKSPSEGSSKSDVPTAVDSTIDSEMPDVLANIGVDAKLDESDLPTEIVDALLDNTYVLAEGSREASAQDPDASVVKTALSAKMEASVVSDAVAQVSAEYVLFNSFEMNEINNSVLLATQQLMPQSKVKVQGIVVDDYPSPAVNMLVPNSDQSVIALDKADPNVEYKDQDKIRVRKVYVGQMQQYMFRQDFKEIADKNEWMSNPHIDSYMDILWRRRSTGIANYLQNITFAPCTFFVQLKKVWSLEMERIQIERNVKEIERTALKTENEAIHGQPKGRKKILPTPQVLEVWDEYPEFLPLEFEPEEHFCTYVRGDDSLYNVPWWTMESVLIPCNTSGHLVLC
ncbi:hypothetical protein Dsin_008435 [Dipteronia sinensis]|uniref:DUF1985 domain-containing protein n=1 Tax=Dipteronia sinensis TaxID=43782 RepID=A0AAE0ECH9_9ROSI|nr:hypothetical protein Dsin_008435 [Dipteronia sinensis]